MRKLTLSALLLLLVVSGCDRQIDSRDPVRSLPEPLPAPVDVQAAIDNQAVVLTWAVIDSAAVNRFRIYVADSTDGEYTLRDSTTGYSRTVSDLMVNHTYLFRVAAVRTDGIEGKRSTAVSATAGVLSITINNNAQYTNRRNVQVQLNAINGTTNVILSEDSTFADAVYEPYAFQKNFTLTQGDGEKTVYARFLFASGAQSGSLLSDDIILDTRARIDSVFFEPNDQIFTTGDTIVFGLDAGEEGGDASVSFKTIGPIALYDDGTDGDLVAGDGIYAARYIVPTDLVVDNSQVTGNFTDAAGNAATPTVAVQTLSIQSSPLPVQLTQTEALASYEVALTWTQAASSDFASYRIYRNPTAAVTEQSKLMSTISAKSTVTYTDTTVNENTKYFYRIYVYNTYGLSAASNVDSATTPANDAPTAVVLAGALAPDSVIALSWSRNADEDFASYRIYRSGSTIPNPPPDNLLIKFINTQSTDTYNDFVPTAGTYRYKVYVYDRQGKFTGSNEVTIGR